MLLNDMVHEVWARLINVQKSAPARSPAQSPAAVRRPPTARPPAARRCHPLPLPACPPGRPLPPAAAGRRSRPPLPPAAASRTDEAAEDQLGEHRAWEQVEESSREKTGPILKPLDTWKALLYAVELLDTF